MPTQTEYIQKQQNTATALSYLQKANNQNFADWIVTVSFYKALHAIESYLATRNIHPQGHVSNNKARGRNDYVKIESNLKQIYPEYKGLYDASRTARYDAYSYANSPQDVIALVKDSEKIENHIQTLLASLIP